MSELLKSEILKDKPLVVSVGKAKALLDCSTDQLYELLRAGEIVSYMERNRRKILMKSIEEFVARRLAATGGKFQSFETTNLPRDRKVAA